MSASNAVHDRRDALYAGLADSLARSIRRGALLRGERMPSVRELARREGVSMSTALQAYRCLEDSGMVEARPRSGYFVTYRPAGPPEPQITELPAGSVSVGIAEISDEVMRRAHDPACISFGAACPNGELFAEERIRRAISRATQRHRSALTHYPLGAGEESLRRAIAKHALVLGCELDPRQILITNGCQAAISLCLRAVTRPGDIVALESPTSFGFLQLLEIMQLRALEIPTHPRLGMALDALQLALDTQPVKAVLTVPTLANPLGACMPLAQRRRLALMAARHGVPVIEDVIYSELAVHGNKQRAVKAFDADGHVMICGSFTKTIAPGIRLGWVEGGRWSRELQTLKAVHTGGQSPLLELAMAELLNRPGHALSLRRLRTAIAVRVEDAREIIATSFPRGTRVTDPPGGFILWLELPNGLDSTRLFEACLQEGICIAPGTMFSATDRYRHCIRLGVGGHWGPPMRQALRRVGEIARSLLELAPDEPQAVQLSRAEA
jgi:DNA-binding transcriptional MocR family regulator